MSVTRAELLEQLTRDGEHADLDFKQELILAAPGDKAAFVKDVLAIANTTRTGYIVTGVEDQSWRHVGATHSHRPETIYEVLRAKVDPPITVEYKEFRLDRRMHGILKVLGENPPYIVAVRDSFGGKRASGGSTFFVRRGEIFIRNINTNDGISRAQLDKLYQQADFILHLSRDESREGPEVFHLSLTAENPGRYTAKFVQIILTFPEARRVSTLGSGWIDATKESSGPMVCRQIEAVHPGLPVGLGDFRLELNKGETDTTVAYVFRGENIPPNDGTTSLSDALSND